MTHNEIIQKITEELITTGPNVPPTEIVIRGNQVFLASDVTLEESDEIFVYELIFGTVKLENRTAKYTAEQWIDNQGFSSLRLITLLDLEGKLTAANKTAVKLQSVRGWMDSLLSAYVQNPLPKLTWNPAPFTFEETVQEAFQVLAS